MRRSKLTPAQLVLWTGQQLAPNSPQYNSALSFELRGALDRDRFSSAFDQLVRECDAMRTVFAETAAVPYQTVLPHPPRPLEEFPAELSNAQVESWIGTATAEPFDISRCCYRAVLHRLSPDRHLFFLNQHHLILDAWGVSVQFHRLAELYRAGNAGTELADELPQFQAYRESLVPPIDVPDYWANAGSQLPPLLLGRSNQIGTSASVRVAVDLTNERMAALEDLAERPGVKHWTRNMTLFHILSSALMVLVSRLTNQAHVVIGTPSANRSTSTERRLPAQLVEVLPLYGHVSTDDTFETLIQRQRIVSNRFLAATRPALSRPVLTSAFNVVLNYITASCGDFTADVQCTTRWHSPGHADPGHHLRMQIHDYNGTGQLCIEFDLNTAVFTESDRRRIPAWFAAILDAMCADPTHPVATVDMYSADEWKEIRERGTGSRSDRTYHSVLEALHSWTLRTPEAPAIVTRSARVSYAELDERCGRLATFIAKRVKGSNRHIALYLPRSADLIVAILACWRAGHVYIPLPPGTPVQRLRHVLVETDCALLCCNEASYGALPPGMDVPVLLLDRDRVLFDLAASTAPASPPETQPAYTLFTSGSTGLPKGVTVSHGALGNYIAHASRHYVRVQKPIFPLFTSIGVDLTVTSIFTPLATGGQIVVYPEPAPGTPDLEVIRVLDQNRSDVVKLTPSHLGLLRGRNYRRNRLRTLIVGGEQLSTRLAAEIADILPPAVEIINEYGPTEATVGCTTATYRPTLHLHGPVPIGKPIQNTEAWVLGITGMPTPTGTIGELYIGGYGLAEGYYGRNDLTRDRFVNHPYQKGQRLYRTGDRTRWTINGELEYIGRDDRQVKWRGFRVELDEVERNLARHPLIRSAAVTLTDSTVWSTSPVDQYCAKCGLPANYPSASFDEQGVCQLCRGFEVYEEKARNYFRTRADFEAIFADRPSEQGAEYDCIMLLSGGKDSTYALGQLVEMGLKVLAFTLDNGYISEQAITNIRRVAEELEVDVYFGSTPAMNEIFVDSLRRHCNVCNGCFKTIYTLSTQLALKKNIPYIVTGLSRGQFFETRLTEELFWERDGEDSIDDTILEARKLYHRADDAVRELLDTSAFADDQVFERVRFLDFYRYTDATLDEMYAYLDTRLPWVRPTDTGRSTNCLINQVGIFVHKKEKGYNNYAFPYSWDVRIGHKDREAALEEINEEVDIDEVERIMAEIGYVGASDSYDSRKLVAYYCSVGELSPDDLRIYLSEYLPSYSIPQVFIPLTELPLTPAGKIDREALNRLMEDSAHTSRQFVEPEGEIEELVAQIWREVLATDRVGRHDAFLQLGGHSLTAIRLAARISETFELTMPLHRIFEFPTIASQASFLEATLLELLNENE